MIRKKKIVLRVIQILGIAAAAGILICLIINAVVKYSVNDNIICKVTEESYFDENIISEIKELDADCIIVLGARIMDKETPSPMLKDRLDVGIELYRQGAAPKLLLSGDNGQEEHNEIHVMLQYAKNQGIPEEDIFCDHAGFSTYDSMYRASSIFGVQKAIVVTQEYHQYRALFIGDKLGMSVWGVASDQEKYMGQLYRDFREILARIKDFAKASLKVDPVLGGSVIPINGSGLISHGE